MACHVCHFCDGETTSPKRTEETTREKGAAMTRGLANSRSEILPRHPHGERGRTPQRLLRPAERMNQIKNPLELGRAPTGQNSMIFWQCCFTSRIAPTS